MGSPECKTPEEALEWARRRFNSLQSISFYALESAIELLGGIESPLFRAVRRYLSKLLRRVRAQVRRSVSIKAILTPLRLNPHSLHPNGLATN